MIHSVTVCHYDDVLFTNNVYVTLTKCHLSCNVVKGGRRVQRVTSPGWLTVLLVFAEDTSS